MHRVAALRTQALAARSAGEHGCAADAWRALLALAPHDWALALELRTDLHEAWHSADSDPAFRRAASSMPDEVWLDHYCASDGLPGAELDAIETRARGLRSSRPGEARIEALVGHVAADRRDWAEAARAYAAASALDPVQPEWPGLAATCRQYARLNRLPDARATGHDTADHDAYVINLDRNHDRLAEMQRRFNGFPVPPQRLPAVDGNRLARSAVASLAAADAPRGTIGCFLSHAAAWERLLAGVSPCALVLEDDAQPMLVLPASTAAFGLPPGWDVVWVNQRMQPQADPDDTTGFTVHPVLDAVRGFPASHNAPGGDGYLISRNGARKLLDWCAADGFRGDVDIRMLAYSLRAPDLAALPTASPTVQCLASMVTDNPRPDRLQSYVLHPHLIRELSLRSTRIDADRLSATV